MKKKQTAHSVDILFSLLLFALFVILLTFLLMFSARMYRESVSGLNQNQNLHTAAAYLTTKFRQHDSRDRVFIGEFAGLPSLCFSEVIADQKYITYIYLQDKQLRELFIGEGGSVDPEMGTPIAELSFFEAESDGSMVRIRMEDAQGAVSCFCLHAGSVSDAF